MNRRKILLAAGAVALLAFLPLRFVLGFSDGAVSARSVEGSIWRGTIKDTAIGGQRIGDLSAGLSPLHLFLAQARIGFSGAMTGAFVRSFSGSGADIEAMTLPMGLRIGSVRLGSLSVSQAHIRYSGDDCRSAEGRVTVQLESPMGARMLSGNLKCAGKVLAADLLSQSAMERLTLRFPDAGHYDANFTVRASDADQALRLTAAGFRETAAGHVIRLSGAM